MNGIQSNVGLVFLTLLNMSPTVGCITYIYTFPPPTPCSLRVHFGQINKIPQVLNLKFKPKRYYDSYGFFSWCCLWSPVKPTLRILVDLFYLLFKTPNLILKWVKVTREKNLPIVFSVQTKVIVLSSLLTCLRVDFLLGNLILFLHLLYLEYFLWPICRKKMLIQYYLYGFVVKDFTTY